MFKVFFCTLLFCTSIFAIDFDLRSRNYKIDGCLKQYFSKAFYCDIEDQRLCDVTNGIRTGNFKGVKCLVNAGFDFNVESGKYPSDYVPLWRAAYFKRDMLKTLFESKIPLDLEVLDLRKRTLLTSLSFSLLLDNGRQEKKLFESSELLLEKGANPNAYDKEKRTPLFFAASDGNTNLVRLLLRYSANPNAQAKNGETALMATGDDVETVELLLKAGANVDLTDMNGDSSIFYAVRECEENKARSILKNNTYLLRSLNKDGLTPLKYYLSLKSSDKCPAMRTLLER